LLKGYKKVQGVDTATDKRNQRPTTKQARKADSKAEQRAARPEELPNSKDKNPRIKNGHHLASPLDARRRIPQAF